MYKNDHFAANFIKIHQELTKLVELLALAIVSMGATILNIYWGIDIFKLLYKFLL